mmetsp:Transcript_33474/g.106733  ORF Transcript_33474/g.106733 Transcript_33474/m.106733 type:complete len:337 (-) Transcript_33474:263-1273(-)
MSPRRGCSACPNRHVLMPTAFASAWQHRRDTSRWWPMRWRVRTHDRSSARRSGSCVRRWARVEKRCGRRWSRRRKRSAQPGSRRRRSGWWRRSWRRAGTRRPRPRRTSRCCSCKYRTSSLRVTGAPPRWRLGSSRPMHPLATWAPSSVRGSASCSSPKPPPPADSSACCGTGLLPGGRRVSPRHGTPSARRRGSGTLRLPSRAPPPPPPPQPTRLCRGWFRFAPPPTAPRCNCCLCWRWRGAGGGRRPSWLGTSTSWNCRRSVCRSSAPSAWSGCSCSAGRARAKHSWRCTCSTRRRRRRRRLGRGARGRPHRQAVERRSISGGLQHSWFGALWFA